jgi:hypothetical protein
MSSKKKKIPKIPSEEPTHKEIMDFARMIKHLRSKDEPIPLTTDPVENAPICDENAMLREHNALVRLRTEIGIARWLVPKLINVVGVSYSLSHVQA